MAFFRQILFLCMIFFLGNCAVGPVSGVLFTSNKFAGEINTTNVVPPFVTATGCQHSILGLVSFGNAGAGDIANNKGIQRIATIDYSTFSILQVVYSRYCTIVTGTTY
ncbi:MAG: TRL-like family protein [Leptospiraceae bacterium]|nr:TRL-like family protein [Leptospiraceae bacterium]MCP5497046.1 TRL-like family protein [Leptospiraceae bacterium]